MRNNTITHDLFSISLLAIALLITTAAAVIAQEDNPVGIVTAVSGNVTATSVEGTDTLAEGDPVFMGDIIRTGADSGVKIVFNDESLISLGDETELEINDFVYTPAQRKSVTNVTRGKVRAIISNIKDRSSDVEFKTKNAVAGIKGTILYINADSEIFGVREGFVDVSGLRPGSVTVSLGPNEYTRVVDGNPIPPKPITDEMWFNYQRETNILEGVPDSSTMFRQDYPGRDGTDASLPVALGEQLGDFPTVPPINLTPGAGAENAVPVDIIVDIN